MRYLVLFIVFLFIAGTDPVNAQRSKRNQNMDNVGKYSLVYFSRPISKDSIKVTAFIEIPFNSIQFIKRKDKFLAFYDASVMLQDKDGKQLFRKTWSDSIVATDYVHTRSRLRTRKHYTNFNIGKEKYLILSELYDKDTRKKGSKKKKIDYTNNKKTPSLMEPIIIADLKGEWGFKSNEFPIIGKKITNIDKGLTINISGFVDDSPYSIKAIINSNKDEKELPLIEQHNNNGFFNHRLKIEKEYLQSLSLKVKIELAQSKQVKKVEKNITIYKPGISGYVNNIENSFRQMKYILTNKERTDAKGMSWKEGWETDFGMIYILFGPPDQIQRSNPDGSNTSVYQVWYYNRINKQYVFKDQNGFGDYRLDSPFIGSNY